VGRTRLWAEQPDSEVGEDLLGTALGHLEAGRRFTLDLRSACQSRESTQAICTEYLGLSERE